jgi:hypothetical protein
VYITYQTGRKNKKWMKGKGGVIMKSVRNTAMNMCEMVGTMCMMSVFRMQKKVLLRRPA